ncbi:MAG: hypothetical protein A3C08_01965 [Candidatus Taylorbacteria bacterium RIFCSPHIGHO2_02_FULL_47_18]|uniref:IPT/TIG domain-containing protein n=1 Tax=Candidatus Taylorbacteria bacterium RIFCSPLOWO2_01_FULL_48_100 TaxID=1802322 RepID=A0A1G2NFI5_9BACT|nr:MAG: hypothetical protein A2670_02795 [Candidatus Taylorbacteria bacterium RIFCSPHIGHO2_01_FULL_48_38]OHA28505.1 MAG: hypothetical protein A3C08_01965 [Candidatus Taylorbacteria bacterium RIFCSPHIGHO2_02_FULL_47_18]OHA34834.1 MAG: hypothetical protein A2938_03010 [Candidatus Taylorbacteria bacterium RIFCSPLOWO2_01_FULL_48_100]OHA40732.1 MAG: hypothetical protein A3J31_00260 [Candidatus Taylorbacteria bacterium RIFCSPLOWO2_02_FULL_48_16]OHA45406.1 MAG: hypothetical protein A3H13_01175 [Candid
MNMNNQKGFANIALIVLVVILAGALGYVTLVKKPAPVEQSQINNLQNTEPSTPPPANNPVSQNPPTMQSPVTPSQSLPTTCIDEVHAPGGKDLPPVITSISPTSGSVGTKVDIRGCNLAGFEGDQMAIFERSDGEKLTFYGSGYNEKVMTVTIADNCPTGSEIGRYSGITSPCETIKALPSVYKVYVITWGDEFKSNLATFTVK